MEKDMRSYLTELVGTFVFVFIGASAVCGTQLAMRSGQPQGGLVGIALAQGIALTLALAFGLPHGTGYFNPAITLMLWVYKRLDGMRTAMFIFVQMVGAALAGGVVRLIFAGNDAAILASRLGTPHVNARAFNVGEMNPSMLLSGIAAEVGFTFLVTIVVFATLIDPRAPKTLGPIGRWLAPLWVGLAQAAVIFGGFNVTGGAANPARWFGTVIWEQSVSVLRSQGSAYSYHMVYWIGPIVGALVAGGLYTSLILPPEEETGRSSGAAEGSHKSPAGALSRAKK